MIAHRLSTIAHADQVVVLRDGRVAEAGPPATLLASHGPFHDLVARQLDGVIR